MTLGIRQHSERKSNVLNPFSRRTKLQYYGIVLGARVWEGFCRHTSKTRPYRVARLACRACAVAACGIYLPRQGPSILVFLFEFHVSSGVKR